MKPASTDQFDAAPAQQIDDRLVVGFAARKRFMVEHFGRNPVVLARTRPISVRFVAQDQFNFGVELFRLDGVDDRLQIGAAAGNQNPDRNLPCHIILSERNRCAARSFANLADDESLLAHRFSMRIDAVGSVFVPTTRIMPRPIIERRVHLRLGRRAPIF